jgi:iron complex transport system substrate-binding protein
VVSLAPSLTEIMFMLGVGHRLVGRTTRCNAPPEAELIPDVGAYMRPDLERVLAVKPDLVLAQKTGLSRELVDRLSELGLPVFVEDCKNLDDVVDLVRRLGFFLATGAVAARVVGDIQQRRIAVAKDLIKLPRPTLLFAVGLRPLVVAGGQSFIGALIREAGGTNIAEDAPLAYPKFSMEEVIRRDPEFIVVLDKECQGEDCFREWQRHSGVKAVRSGNVYTFDADLIARPTPRIVEALEELARILHPGIGHGTSARRFSHRRGL